MIMIRCDIELHHESTTQDKYEDRQGTGEMTNEGEEEEDDVVIQYPGEDRQIT